MKYIALLRGINVSGQKKVKMLDLRTMCEKMTFLNVQTYIQSGNIIFEYKDEPTEKIALSIHQQIEETFGYDVPVMVFTQSYLEEVVAKNPFLLTQPDGDPKQLHVTFLTAEPVIETIEELQQKDYGLDVFRIVADRIYLCLPNGYGRTKLTNNFFEKKLKLSATTRNWRTLHKLLTY